MARTVPRLVLFDIDGTLVDAADSGRRAMDAAGVDVFGPGFNFDGVSFAGNLDRLIFAEACARAGAAVDDARHLRFRDAYLAHLARLLEADEAFLALPGARESFDHVRAQPAQSLGLLTGNYPGAARLKLHRGGMDFDAVEVGAYGDEADDRADLVLLARDRFRAAREEPLDFAEILIIGDTPHDVRCALEHGCQLLAVATGRFDAAALRAAGAERVTDRLSPEELR